jgi:fumarate hydratase class I
LLKLRDGIVELYRKVATSLPPDVEEAVRAAAAAEEDGSSASSALRVVLDNVKSARERARPLCQDTGVPVFFVKVPVGLSHKEIRETIVEATRIATESIPLRPNAVDVISERNSGDNTGLGFPVIYIDESPGSTLSVDLMLKGGGSENVGLTYKLPDEGLRAVRDLAGVKKCVLDTVVKAQGRACPPYIIAVGVGAAKDQVTRLSKEQLLRKVSDVNPVPELAALERDLVHEINRLGIGPQGLGGRSTALAVKAGVNHRHPATYFVDVAVGCWAHRRGRLIW